MAKIPMWLGMVIEPYPPEAVIGNPTQLSRNPINRDKLPINCRHRPCTRERAHCRCAVITDNVTEQNAMSIMTAFAACEYSHATRNGFQSSGKVVQLAVA
jgi:hypothetical protein